MRPTDADLRAGIAAHGDRVERFRRGALTPDQFRPIRLSYGLYYQLDHTSHMQRIKLPAGVITAPQAECLAEITDRWGRGVLHVTTREDVQIHWVPIENVVEMYEMLHEVGITTRGACADSVRNVTGCIHAGVLPGELFDVTPYVMAVHEYFLFNPLNLTFPRKFKIAFASCAYDCVQGPINDIAYYPHVVDGKPGFHVLAGGGLGAQPFLARHLRDFLPAEDLLIMSEAIARVQHRHGERKNRSRARMKYVVKKWGEERFRQEVEAEFARVEAECGAELRQELREIVAAYVDPKPARAAGKAAEGDATYSRWRRTNTFEQKQPGYFGVDVQVPLGDLTTQQLRTLSALSTRLGNGILRASNDQNLMIPWISGADLPEVRRVLEELSLADPDALHITDVVSCPGADYCSLAMSRSMGVAAEIRHHLVTQGDDAEPLGVFRIRISGCPNSCGQHHVGDIGLTGMTVKGADGVERPHYSFLIGGAVGEDGGAVGQRLHGKYNEIDVPKIVAALAGFYRERRQTGESFRNFAQRVGMPALAEVSHRAAGN
jgi:sulfite reductase beta subunit-like hemoprotein